MKPRRVAFGFLVAVLFAESARGLPVKATRETNERPAIDLPGTPAAPAAVIAPDGALLVAWEQWDGAPADVFFRRREAGNLGWAALRRLDTDPPGSSRSLEPQIAAGPHGHVVAVWQDSRGGLDHVRAQASTDGGRTWRPEDVAVAAPEALATLPSVAVDDLGRAFVAWEDRRFGARDILLARSSGGGALFEELGRADSDAPGSGASYHPRLVVFPDRTLLVVWWDERDGAPDVYARRSTDGGSTWAGEETRLDPGKPGAAPSRATRLVPSVGALVVSWEEGWIGTRGARWARRTTDAGATWSAPERAPEVDEDVELIAAGETLRVTTAEAEGRRELLVRIRPAR